MLKFNWKNIWELLRGRKINLSDPDYNGCGITALVYFTEDHPFTPACTCHDRGYLKRVNTRLQVDKKFLRDMLEIAGYSPKLISTAYLWYGVVRGFGGLLWKD